MNNVIVSAAGNPCVAAPVLAPVLAWLLSQLIKFLLALTHTGTLLPERLIGSGGMPSAHSATVCALAASVAITSGVGGTDFALAAVFALVVMYDAQGVRWEAGRHAKILNELMTRVSSSGQPFSSERPFRELVGHTMLQVICGAVLGILAAIGICHAFR